MLPFWLLVTWVFEINFASYLWAIHPWLRRVDTICSFSAYFPHQWAIRYTGILQPNWICKHREGHIWHKYGLIQTLDWEAQILSSQSINSSLGNRSRKYGSWKRVRTPRGEGKQAPGCGTWQFDICFFNWPVKEQAMSKPVTRNTGMAASKTAACQIILSKKYIGYSISHQIPKRLCKTGLHIILWK